MVLMWSIGHILPIPQLSGRNGVACLWRQGRGRLDMTGCQTLDARGTRKFAGKKKEKKKKKK
jgi:hypothetical protein